MAVPKAAKLPLSYAVTPVNLRGSAAWGRPLRTCTVCGPERHPEGGIDTPTGWRCAACWRSKRMRAVAKASQEARALPKKGPTK